jgi:hypothetical protein
MAARPLSSYSQAEWARFALAMAALVVLAFLAWQLLAPKPAPQAAATVRPPALPAPTAPMASTPADLEHALETAHRFVNWTVVVERLGAENGDDLLVMRVPGASWRMVSHRFTLTPRGVPQEDKYKIMNMVSEGDRVIVSGELATPDRERYQGDDTWRVLVRELKKP